MENTALIQSFQRLSALSEDKAFWQMVDEARSLGNRVHFIRQFSRPTSCDRASLFGSFTGENLMSFVTSFGILPHTKPRSAIQNAVLPWGLTSDQIEGVQPQRKKRRASAPAPVAEKASQKTKKTKPAEAIEQQPVRFFDLMLAALKTQHQPQMEQQLGKLPELASERGIKLFCLSKNDCIVDALIQIFRGAADSHKGSFALVGLRVRNPIVVIIEEEIKAIASQLKLKPWVVLQAMACHELAHCVGWTACDLLNDPYFLSEQIGWDWGENIRAEYATVSQASFDRVAEFCLKSHGINTGDDQ